MQLCDVRGLLLVMTSSNGIITGLQSPHVSVVFTACCLFPTWNKLMQALKNKNQNYAEAY